MWHRWSGMHAEKLKPGWWANCYFGGIACVLYMFAGRVRWVQWCGKGLGSKRAEYFAFICDVRTIKQTRGSMFCYSVHSSI